MRACASPAAARQIDEEVFERFASRLSYLSGDFGDAGTYQRLAQPSARCSSPVFYLEIPPSLFGMVIKGLAEAGLTKNGRVVVEKPFGHDLASARALSAEIREHMRGVPAVSHRPFPGQDGHRRAALPALWQHDDRADLEPQPHRLHADHDGRGLRRRGPRALLRSRGRAARCGRQPPDAGRGASPRWRRPPATTRDTLKDAKFAVFRSTETAEPAHYVRGQYDGYLRYRRRRKGLNHGDLCRDAPADRQLALGGRALVHPHGEEAAGDADGAARRLPAPAAPGLHGARRTAGPSPTSSWSSSTLPPARA